MLHKPDAHPAGSAVGHGEALEGPRPVKYEISRNQDAIASCFLGVSFLLVSRAAPSTTSSVQVVISGLLTSHARAEEKNYISYSNLYVLACCALATLLFLLLCQHAALLWGIK